MPMPSLTFILMNNQPSTTDKLPLRVTAVVVLVIGCIYAIGSCCYHYQKLRLLRRSSDSNSATAEPQAAAAAAATTKSTPFHQSLKKPESESLPV